MTLADVIARLDDLPETSTIYAEWLAPSARAWVADSSTCASEAIPYAFDVAAARSAFGRGTGGCPWRRRAVSSRRA